jgi:hypothetical protein
MKKKAYIKEPTGNYPSNKNTRDLALDSGVYDKKKKKEQRKSI